jgi:hypothetical protein
VTFLALGAADGFYSYTVHFTILYIIMIFFVYAVKTVAFKVYCCISVAVYAPAHAKRGKLIHLTHLSNFAVAVLASLLACHYVLLVIKINMVG